MHTARSRNDQVALDIRLKIRYDINILLQCLIETISTLLKTAQENTKTIMPLYTHLQQAQVGVFSHDLLSYADSLLRDLDRFMSLYGRVNQSPLGAGPVGGTGLHRDRGSTAKLLGFASIIDRSTKKSLKIKKNVISHMKIEVPTYKKNKLPHKLKNTPITIPGSRFIK